MTSKNSSRFTLAIAITVTIMSFVISDRNMYGVHVHWRSVVLCRGDVSISICSRTASKGKEATEEGAFLSTGGTRRFHAGLRGTREEVARVGDAGDAEDGDERGDDADKDRDAEPRAGRDVPRAAGDGLARSLAVRSVRSTRHRSPCARTRVRQPHTARVRHIRALRLVRLRTHHAWRPFTPFPCICFHRHGA